jgi:hypothetical protein
MSSLDKKLEVYDYNKKEIILSTELIEKLVYLGIQRQ